MGIIAKEWIYTGLMQSADAPTCRSRPAVPSAMEDEMSDTPKMKFCVDCKWHQPTNTGRGTVHAGVEVEEMIDVWTNRLRT